MTHSPPNWLALLSDRVLSLVTPHEQLPGAGCHYTFEEGVWEVTLFIGFTETVGGEFDGNRTDSPFSFDLTGLPSCFDEFHRMWWQSLPIDGEDDLGSHISAEGLLEGDQVWLRITAQAPQQFGPARQEFLYDRPPVDLW